MISFPQALKLLTAQVPTLGVERVRIEECTGRVLRRTLTADRDLPPYDRVMMDGHAMRAADFARSHDFRIVGKAPAGAATATLPAQPNVCLEVMTGAPLPMGADCIVPIEHSGVQGEQLRVESIYQPIALRHVHRAGSDAHRGQVLLTAGIHLGSREIGVAASCGAAWLEVSALPRIAVVATGDELVPVDHTPEPHQIRQSNAHAIASALRHAGQTRIRSAHLGDDEAAAQPILQALLDDSDWLILSGAVSKGSRDFVPALLERLGCKCLFHGIAQRPGKPAGCWHGPKGQIIAALPGNPVSALTTLHALVLPALAAASAATPTPARWVDARLHSSHSIDHMTHHLPVTLGPCGTPHAAATNTSGDFIGLLKSAGFVTLPPSGEHPDRVIYTPWL